MNPADQVETEFQLPAAYGCSRSGSLCLELGILWREVGLRLA